jgi:hypothetical protein
MKKLLVLALLLFSSCLAFGQISVSIPQGMTGTTGSVIQVPIIVGDVTGQGILSYQSSIPAGIQLVL